MSDLKEEEETGKEPEGRGEGVETGLREKRRALPGEGAQVNDGNYNGKIRVWVQTSPLRGVQGSRGRVVQV